MAFEFSYQLRLDLIHGSMDPREISGRMIDLKPNHTAKAGEQIQLKTGRIKVPIRSVWQARLHEEEFLHSATDDFAEVMNRVIGKLRPYSDLFQEIRKDGYAYLQLVWFSDSAHSARVIPAEVLIMCGSIGLDLDIEFYAPLGEIETK